MRPLPFFFPPLRRFARQLQPNCFIEDLGATLDARTACNVAASAGRRARNVLEEHRGKHPGTGAILVFTTSEPELIPYLSPDAVLFLPSGRVCINPLPALERRPELCLRFDANVGDCGAVPRSVKRVAAPDAWRTLTTTVAQDAATSYAAAAFEMDFNGIVKTEVCAMLPLPHRDAWNVGALVGPSGSGKSVLLRDAASRRGGESVFAAVADADSWPPDGSVLSVLCERVRARLPPGASGDAACLAAVQALLTAVGLRKGAWLLPWSCLSAGERDLVALVEALASGDVPGKELVLIVIDEFTSSLDAVAAYTAATGVAAYARSPGREHLRILAAGVRANLGGMMTASFVFDVQVGLAGGGVDVPHRAFLPNLVQCVSHVRSGAGGQVPAARRGRATAAAADADAAAAGGWRCRCGGCAVRAAAHQHRGA